MLQVLGTWHAVEIIQHRENKAQVIGRTKVSSCPTLVLSRPEAHIIRLLWTEKAVIVQYNFFVVDLNRPGYWVSSGAQNGSELYSVVMARKKQLPHEEITGVHKMLAARGFVTYSVKEACRDSASAVFAGSLLLVTFVTLLL
ncbi:hypothetical protein AAG570_010336 [Ranatra chinensis]|uniref:Lipocalin/cytosolic fatty-acid binding domain-containing protein n=1 Tax=Ranatra chinensis TaxID=642074 RepID=A0ABD0YMP2_9HEMI